LILRHTGNAFITSFTPRRHHFATVNIFRQGKLRHWLLAVYRRIPHADLRRATTLGAEASRDCQRAVILLPPLGQSLRRCCCPLLSRHLLFRLPWLRFAIVSPAIFATLGYAYGHWRYAADTVATLSSAATGSPMPSRHYATAATGYRHYLPPPPILRFRAVRRRLEGATALH